MRLAASQEAEPEPYSDEESFYDEDEEYDEQVSGPSSGVSESTGGWLSSGS